MRSSLHGLWAMALVLVACDEITGPTVYVAEEPFSITLAASNVSRFRLNGISGNSIITGVSATDSVRITGVRQVGSRESQKEAIIHLDDLQVQFGLQGGAIVVSTVQPSLQEGPSYTVHYEVTLPRHLDVGVNAVNGDVHVSSLESFGDAKVVNGTLTLDGIVGSVSADVVNGTIRCDATLPLNGTMHLDVANGNTNLTIPMNTSAQFSAGVANGTIAIFGLHLQIVTRTRNHVTGRLGSGQGVISLDTGNGTITVWGN